MNAAESPTPSGAKPGGRERFSAAVASGFRRYAEWLVAISWKRFFLLSILLLIGSAILAEIPPFSFKFTISADDRADTRANRKARAAKLKELKDKYGDVDVRIDETGIHVTRKRDARAAKPEAKEAPGGSAQSPPATDPPSAPATPPAAADEIRSAIDEVREEIRDAVDEEIAAASEKPKTRTIQIGSFLPNLALLLIVASAVIKIAYAGRVEAEERAAAAQQAADSESLKRQVIEARMAAMQAQVEPHFLFNTLASIDHLIEVDPARASRMQKNLIALLRASMPALREGGAADLGRELAMVRPYLEILQVRMQERLRTEINVSEGLYSAEFPPMMLQSLVENAIQHGLEPKAEGGTLAVSAEVAHGKLAVTVADTGVGFGRAATAGTGIGLDNIRERLKLLYGSQAELRIAENAPAGTRATIVVPYRSGNARKRA